MTRAYNEFGLGEYSEQLSVALADSPAAPATLAKVDSESGTSYITLEWPASASTEIPVLGYRLSLSDDSLGTDVFEEVYNGYNYPNVLKYTVSSEVVSGMAYTFQVQALNYNGAGPASSSVGYTICTAPQNLFPPNMTAVTATTMTLTWEQPASDGGC